MATRERQSHRSAMKRKRLYADETQTGRNAHCLRGLGSVTIAAHCSSGDDFEWLLKFQRDVLPQHEEMKSQLVLAKAAADPHARDYLLCRIESATIVIIDFAQHTKKLIECIQALTGGSDRTIPSVKAFLGSGRLPPEVADAFMQFVRTQTIERSIIGSVEGLLRQAATISGAPVRSDGQLFDREALCELSDGEFKELVTRFSIALGEALRPEAQADRIILSLADRGFAHDGHIAMACLECATDAETVFDQGSINAFKMLNEADLKIQRAVDHWSGRLDSSEASRLAQGDSRSMLGLQAADIAAGYAAQLFETADTDTMSAAIAVKTVFPNVLLNDQWL